VTNLSLDQCGPYLMLDRDGLSSRARVSGNAKLGVENPLRLADIRALYPTFESIFQKHVRDAKFDGELKRNVDSKALKLEVGIVVAPSSCHVLVQFQ